MTPVPAHPLSFGIKTTQAGATYEEILRTWRDADRIPLLSTPGSGTTW